MSSGGHQAGEGEKGAEPQGRRRPRAQLSAHVPIRFRPDVIAKVRVLAGREHKTVSSWIREVVEAEADRRLPVHPQTKGPDIRVSLDRPASPTTHAAPSRPGG